MCNLYSLTKGQAAIRALFRVSRDLAGNLPAMPAIFPDALAPIIRFSDANERQLELMRWGMPPPPQFGAAPVTNIRKCDSPHWRSWLGRENRCLVPVTSFCEWTDSPPKIPHWFALSEERPLFAFAGIWCEWQGLRGPKANQVEGKHRLHGLLTTEANDTVRPIHAKAMPVVLTREDEFETWLNAPISDALKLQRPAPSHILQIVAKGEKSDGADRAVA
jgi:putative SOS response-associated peptidase YedK